METDIGGPQGGFQPTLWTNVLKAKDPDSPERREALERLIQAYWKPVYFFVRRRGKDVEAAKDLTQGFFAALLERDYLQYVERDRGKFRTFLLTAVEHYMSDAYDRDRALKRGGGQRVLSLDYERAESEVGREPAGGATPDEIYNGKWAREVMRRALVSLRGAEFQPFKLLLSARETPSYAEVAQRLGLTETDVKNRVHMARLRYREAILREIRSYAADDDAAREELGDLFAAFKTSTGRIL